MCNYEYFAILNVIQKCSEGGPYNFPGYVTNIISYYYYIIILYKIFDVAIII